MSSLARDIKQAIKDFDGVKTALEENGVDVPYDTDTKEYGNKVRELYLKGVNEGATRELRPATETDLGGIIIGENLSVTSDGTTTVKTANEINSSNKLPAKSSDVAKRIEGAYMTNEEIEKILQNFS